MALRPISEIPPIERVAVDPEAMAAFTRERQFTNLALDLLAETGAYACYAGAMTDETGTWSRDEAAVGGNMIRLYKLTHAILDQASQDRGELMMMMVRLGFETVVNLRFMIHHFSPELVNSYVTYSMKHERKLLETIERNVAANGGEARHIEDRMKRSLERTANASGVSYDQVDMKQKNWGGKNTYEKAKALDWNEAYLGAFSGPSHNIHGSWQELYASHLEWDGNGRFTPKLEFTRPRPQPIYSMCWLITEGLYDYYAFKVGEENMEGLWAPVADLQERVIAVDEAHEAYLQRRPWPTT